MLNEPKAGWWHEPKAVCDMDVQWNLPSGQRLSGWELLELIARFCHPLFSDDSWETHRKTIGK